MSVICFFPMIAKVGLLTALLAAAAVSGEDRYSRNWAVELRGTKADADRIAAKHGFLNHGPVCFQISLHLDLSCC